MTDGDEFALIAKAMRANNISVPLFGNIGFNTLLFYSCRLKLGFLVCLFA